MSKINFRIEHDTMGEIKVPADKYWGAQTERSRQNFKIGVDHEFMPLEIIKAFAILKKSAAKANNILNPAKMTNEKLNLIVKVCDEIISGSLNNNFPLVVWQTGSGTQSNMNINEVIANRANELAGKKILHPNDDVNMSQSSNDTFPTAMYIAAVIEIENNLIPEIKNLIDTFKNLELENKDIIKTGRTHLQDAAPLKFSQEISGWRSTLEQDIKIIETSLNFLSELAIGGTAVGTGLNAPKNFDVFYSQLNLLGLDSEPSKCIIYYEPNEINNKKNNNVEDIRSKEKLIDFCEENYECRRKKVRWFSWRW